MQYEINYNNSVPDGNWISWFENGLENGKGFFENGTGEFFEFFESGEKAYQLFYKDGFGIKTYWHKNGEKESQANFINGKLNGKWTYWNENGHTVEEEKRKLEEDKAKQPTEVELELKNQLEAEIAAKQQAFERELYTQLLYQEIQEEQSSELMQKIKNQEIILKNAWVNNIAAEVRSNWRFSGENPDWFVKVLVTQNKEGKVLNITFGENNIGNSDIAKAFLNSVERAVYKSTPLPIAPDVSVWDKNVMFIFTP